MIEGAASEMIRPVEKPRNNNVQKNVQLADKLGRVFFRQDYKLRSWNEKQQQYNRGSNTFKEVDVYKSEKDNRNLKIKYTQPIHGKENSWQMDSLSFILSDGKTEINLQKTEEGWNIIRKKSNGVKVEGGQELRKKEEKELSNFLHNMWFDIRTNSLRKSWAEPRPRAMNNLVVPVLTMSLAAGAAYAGDQ